MKKLLFVDDDSMVLAGLRRALHDMRGEWRVDFAGGGPAALDAMEKEPFDAVITDMRMPGMDGAELLEQIKDRHPEVIRIVLSGQSEKEAMLRSIVPAHQYLAKPCDIRDLKLRLGQAFAARDLLREPSIAAAIARLHSVPSLPAIYGRLTAALRSETTSLAQIEEIVAKDPAMAAKILQLANSAFIGAHGQVLSLRQAVSLIGLDTVRTLALTIHVFSQFGRDAATSAQVRMLWEHSVEVAGLAQRIATAESGHKTTAEECFAAGLLHDLGKVILLSERAAEYGEIRSRLQSGCEMDIEALEAEVLGCSHAQLGAYLLSIWGLPASLVHAVAFHHRPSQAIESGFSALTAVHCADALVHASHDGHAIVAVDRDYLEGLEMTTGLDEWRRLLQP